MPPPKSSKLLREEAKPPAEPLDLELAIAGVMTGYDPDAEIAIREVVCCNDFVAILQFRIVSTLELAGTQFKSEGMVVGVGPGLPSGMGQRTPSQLTLGDVISFYGQPILTIDAQTGPYAGKRIVIVSERFVICKLKPVPFAVIPQNE